MAYNDSNGILRVETSDDVSQLHSVFNSLAQSTSNAIGANTRVWPVANIAGRAAKVTEIGASNITAAKPLIVWRADAPQGSNLEYTINGSVWHSYRSSDYPDDTGWVDCEVTPGISIRTGDPSNLTRYRPQVRRIGKTVYFKGHFNPLTSSSPSALFTVPAGFEPVEEVRWLTFSTNRAYSPFGGYLPSNGVCTIQTPSAGSPQYPPAHFSPIIPPYLVN